MGPLHPQGENVESVFISHYPEGSPKYPVSHDLSGNHKVPRVVITEKVLYSPCVIHVSKMWLRDAVK